MKNYEFIKDDIAKKFTVRFIGFFTVDGAKNYEVEYASHVRTIDSTTGYKLILDARELKTFSPDILPVLESCYKRYMKDFKDIELWLPTNSTTGKMQLQRIAKEVGFNPVFK